MRLGGSQGGSDLLNPPPWHRGSGAGRVGRQQEDRKNKEKKSHGEWSGKISEGATFVTLK